MIIQAISLNTDHLLDTMPASRREPTRQAFVFNDQEIENACTSRMLAEQNGVWDSRLAMNYITVITSRMLSAVAIS